MKVLQILGSHRLGGTETFVIDLVSRLQERGVDSYLANLWVPSEMHTVALRKLSNNYYGILGGKYFFGPSCLFRILSFLRKEKFDIVHAYGLRVSLVVRLMRLLAPCKVLCIGIRGLDQQRSTLESFTDRITERLVDKVVCNAKAVAESKISREKTNPEKIVVIPNGIDTNRFAPDRYQSINRAQLGLQYNGFLVACVGNFRAEKDHRNLIEAVGRIRNNINSVRFLLVGQDPMRQEIEQAVRHAKLEESFHFTGARQDIPELLSVCDAFVLPSRSEGMPRSLMEAMSMQLPVVSTDAGGVTEIIENRVSGIIVPKCESKALSEALLEIIHDPLLCQSLGEAARLRILHHFSLEAMVDQYEKFYRSLVS